MKNIKEIITREPVFKSKDPQQDQKKEELLNRLAVLVGSVESGLPLILLIGAVIGGSCMRDSISHFYYAQFLGAMFVGLLFFIGGFLIAYIGEHWLENWESNIAGACAFGVALFPTSGTGCHEAEFLSRVFVKVTNGVDLTVTQVPDRGYFELFGAASGWHLTAAGVVFVYLALFCLFVLRRIIPERHMKDGQLIPSKLKRNQKYTYCGLTILVCVAVLLLKSRLSIDHTTTWNRYNLTFYVETIALWAFAYAWFIKGRLFEGLND